MSDDYFDDDDDLEVSDWRRERDLEADREFAPYAPKHRAKAPPISGGGWSGRGTRGIVPYQSFDGATLQEAVAILDGTSQFYRFDGKGKLETLLPRGHNMDTYLKHAQRRNELLQLRGSNNNASIKRIKTRVDALNEQLQQAKGEKDEAYTISRKFEAQYSRAYDKAHDEGYRAAEPYIPQQKELKKVFESGTMTQTQLEEYQALVMKINTLLFPPVDLGAEFNVGRKAAEAALTKAETNCKKLSGRLKKLDRELHDREIIADGDRYAELKAEFLPLMALGDNDALSDTDRNRRWELVRRLDAATAMLDPAMAPTEEEMISEASEKIGVRTVANIFSGMLGIGKDLSPISCQALRAAIAMLANTALTPMPSDPAAVLRQRIKLTAISQDGGSLGRGIDSMFDDLSFDSGMDWGPPPASVTHGMLNELESDLDQLRALDAGAQPPEELKYVLQNPKDEERESIDWKKYIDPYDIDHESDDYYKKRWNKDKLLLHTMQAVRSFERDHPDLNLMRFHNSHPEAVNFILAAQDAQFLMRHGGEAREIDDIQSFVNSYWMNMVGNIEITVDPQLLSSTRRILTTQPMRPLQQQPLLPPR